MELDLELLELQFPELEPVSKNDLMIFYFFIFFSDFRLSYNVGNASPMTITQHQNTRANQQRLVES